MCNIFRTVTILLLMGLIVGIAAAWVPGVPVKNITLGEYIEEHDAVNRDARGILPENTMSICCIRPVIDTHTNKTVDVRSCNNYLGPDDHTFGTEYRQIAIPGDYYAVQYPSPYLGKYNRSISNENLDLKKFREDNTRIYTILPAPVPTFTTAPTPEPTTIPTTEPTINYQATIAAIEEKVTEHETQIAEIRATIAKTPSPTPDPTIVPTTEPTITIQAPTVTMPSPTPTIDYDARIAELDKRIAEAEEQARKQDDLIYQIMKFLGLAE